MLQNRAFILSLSAYTETESARILITNWWQSLLNCWISVERWMFSKLRNTKEMQNIIVLSFTTPNIPLYLHLIEIIFFYMEDSFCKQNIKVNKIFIPNGSKYEEEDPLISNADALKISQSPEDVFVFSYNLSRKTVPSIWKSVLSSTGMHSTDDSQNLFKMVLIDPYAASSNSRIFVLVYRFQEREKIMTEIPEMPPRHSNQIFDITVVVIK